MHALITVSDNSMKMRIVQATQHRSSFFSNGVVLLKHNNIKLNTIGYRLHVLPCSSGGTGFLKVVAVITFARWQSRAR